MPPHCDQPGAQGARLASWSGVVARFACVALLFQALAGKSESVPLFVEASGVTPAAAGAGPFSRTQMLRLNPALAVALQSATPAVPVNLLLNLFSDERHGVMLDQIEIPEAGSFVCRGRVTGRPDSLVILAIHDGAIAGSVFVPGRGNFQIQHAGNGWQRVAQVEPLRTPKCGVENHSFAASSTGQVPASGIFQPADGPPTNSIIDLLVVYTPAARVGAGGANGILALIDVAVAEVNTSLSNSLVHASVRLVHSAEVPYVETGNINEDLDELEQGEPGAGPIQLVYELRGQYQADLVCMITETTGGPLGLANLMREVGPEFAEHAFSVVQRQFANTYFVMAHELGHNMGCQHDRANSSGSGAYSFSYGHRFAVSNVNYHDVMSPQPGLPIPYYSNPSVSFLGVPTGIPLGQTNAASNARTLELTLPIVAQFSSQIRTGVPPRITLVAPTNGAVLNFSAAITLITEVEDDDDEVEEVEFKLDGQRLAGILTPPFTFLWTNATQGVHTLRAEARDQQGWRTLCQAVTVTVVMPPPTFDWSATGRHPDGTFQMRLRGLIGQSVRIDTSVDLYDWWPISTNVLVNGQFDFLDTVTNETIRFYRAVPAP